VNPLGEAAATLLNVKIEVDIEAEDFDQLSKRAFLAFDEVKHDSQPGYPYCNLFPDKESIRYDQTRYNGFTARQIFSYQAARQILFYNAIHPEDFRHLVSYEQIFLLNDRLVEVKRPFVKGEPTKARKVNAFGEQTPRIVVGVSVVEEIRVRVLFPYETAPIGESNAYLGWGNTKFEDADIFRLNLQATAAKFPNYNLVASDVFNYEGTSSHSTYMVFSHQMAKATGKYYSNINAMTNTCTDHSHSIFIIDSQLYVSVVPGITVSGSLLTSIFNSFGRISAALKIGSIPFVNGDDCVEFYPGPEDQMKRDYFAHGYTVRNVEPCTPDQFSFCSFQYDYTDGTSDYIYQNVVKHAIAQAIKGVHSDGILASLSTLHSSPSDEAYDVVQVVARALTHHTMSKSDYASLWIDPVGPVVYE